jgi:Trehalose receptor
MEFYYQYFNNHWVLVVYDDTGTTTARALGYFLFICNLLSLYAWNYADLLITNFSRALYYKFKILRQVAEHKLLTMAHDEQDQTEWNHLPVDHATLRDLLKKFAKFLSPLVFASFAVNVFYICLQVTLRYQC